MRIGIQATNISGAGGVGGQFQVLIMILDALYQSDIEHEFYLFYSWDDNELSSRYQKKGWNWIAIEEKQQKIPISKRFKEMIKNVLRVLGVEITILRRKSEENLNVGLKDVGAKRGEKLSRFYNLDLMIFPTWTNQCWDWGVPFIFEVHDLQHRLQPEFPEVSYMENEWARREGFFSTAIQKASIVLVDSDEGKKNVLQFYHCDSKKVKVISRTVPSGSKINLSEEKTKRIVKKLNLPTKFFFYPAQFWPHKNHYRIIEAIGMLKKKYSAKIPIVLNGVTFPEWDVLSACQALAERYGIEDQVFYLGYISDEELIALYKNAVALVMPTYFGPTNIPYLEAFYHSCPVIASDLPGVREQVGNAALLVNPKDTEIISQAIYNLWTDQALREDLIKKGKEQLKNFSPKIFENNLDTILKELHEN